MATPVILDAYGEDGDFEYANGAVGGGVAIQTNGNTFRGAYARCSVGFGGEAANVFGTRALPAPISAGWVGARVHQDDSFNFTNARNPAPFFFGLTDPQGIPRILLTATSDSGAATQNMAVYKMNAAGAATQIGQTISGFSTSPSVPDKFDCNFNYAVDGSLVFYINGTQVFSYSGDITTDGETQITGIIHGNMGAQASLTYWSECVVSDSDTRAMTVATSVGRAAGTEDDWTGEVTNVNNAAVNDADYDTTTTPGAIQRYLMGAIATGNFLVVAKVTNLRATQGAGPLSRIALAELIGGNAYMSDPVELPASFENLCFIEPVNPATGQPWTIAELNDPARESGYQGLS